MRGMSRRDFVKAGLVAAGAAAAGIAPAAGVREHGPVEIKTFFLSRRPASIEGSLLADEARDLFAVRVLHGGREASRAELWLSSVRAVVASPGKVARLGVRADGDGGREMSVRLVSTDRKLYFLVDPPEGGRALPVWLRLDDVRRVI